MAFNSDAAEENLQNIIAKVRDINTSIQRDVVDYRRNDRLVDERDEYNTLRDIRFYLLRSYRELDEVLSRLDRYV
jgi:hypothetical protein